MRCRAFLALVLATLLLAATVAASAGGPVPLEEYAARRARLRAELEAPVVLFGYSGREDVSPETTFRQEENFYYLSGHSEEEAALLLIPVTEEARAAQLPEEILFLLPRNKPREHWDGVRLGPEDPGARERTGFAEVKPVAVLRADIERVAALFPTLYTLFPAPRADARAAHAQRWVAWLKEIVPHTNLADILATLGSMRQMKSRTEQALLRRAVEHTAAAHREAMQTVRPGLYEYEIAAHMEYSFKQAGCQRLGYPPIVGSGFNSTVLHYNSNGRLMQAGEVVLIDVGAECDGYTADVTRTLPVSGRFSERQREIYEIVLGAQNAVLAALKPGMTLAREGENSLYQIAYDYINSHGKDKKGGPLGPYFIHGLGHHIGLAVHDAGDPARPLEPGMVVTIEPGVYLPEENLGVRIEDVVLITEDGAELLTASLPRTVEEIERFMAAAGPKGSEASQ
jgi:Xaa-Pro aminopeptidase